MKGIIGVHNDMLSEGINHYMMRINNMAYKLRYENHIGGQYPLCMSHQRCPKALFDIGWLAIRWYMQDFFGYRR